MHEGVTIEPACLRDASFVMAHMRPADEEEVLCQVPENVKRHELTHSLLMSGDNYCASYEGTPAMFFGTQVQNVVCLSIWAVGTRFVPRVLPDVTRFLIEDYIPAGMSKGFLCMEAKSLATHHDSHRWMRSTGAVVHGPPFVYGRNREMFLLFRWTPEALNAARKKWVKP